MIVSSPTLSVCSRLFFFFSCAAAARAGWDDRDRTLSLVGQVCREVSPSENERDAERKLFIREHQLQCLSLFSASLFLVPSCELLFHLFPRLFFFLTPSVSPFLPLLLAILFLLPLSPLSAAITDFFLPRLKYEYFRAKKLKGNNEMAPKLNYTPFPESQKRDFWVMSTPLLCGCVFCFYTHTHKQI